ncbi:MAG: cyanoexosortase B system-associated protein [Leptolyngbyaceae cyanobacterium]
MNKGIQVDTRKVESRKTKLPILIAVGLLAIACVAIAPSYLSGNWVWSQTAQLPEVRNLRAIRQSGLEVPGWNTVDQRTEKLNHKQWSFQILTPILESDIFTSFEIDPEQLEVFQEVPISLILRPQSNANDEPLVEWIDINAFFNRLQTWTVDERRTMQFAIGPNQDPSISARYSRGWQRLQGDGGLPTTYTYAVAQWYVWPTGGSPDIADWFWADQERQWRDRQRMPWVAVTLMIPIKPLGDIAPTQPLAEAIAQTIQTALTTQLLSPSPPR